MVWIYPLCTYALFSDLCVYVRRPECRKITLEEDLY